MSSCVIEWADKPNHSSSRVVCDNLSCMAVSPFAQTEAKAIAAWNAVASLKSRLAASERRVEDLELMLRARLGLYHKQTTIVRFSDGRWTLQGAGWILDVPEDGSGLPALTDKARSQLKADIAAQAVAEGKGKSG